MENQTIKQYQGKKVNIVLKNDFKYLGITFILNNEGCVEFFDRFNEKIVVDPDYVAFISVFNESHYLENKSKDKQK